MALFRNIKFISFLSAPLLYILGASSSLAVNYGAAYETWKEDEGFQVTTWVYPDGKECLAFGNTSYFMIQPNEAIDFEVNLKSCDKSVLVGLGFYLPFNIVLTYSIGTALRVWTDRRFGAAYANDVGVPVASGMIVGEALVGVGFALAKVMAGA